ncbi:uncharacterized protein LOC128235828 [Mya arenaria]|uniref:uncharacterized protein LOC128235828 n=1 Tax=Mya arenaria TaxID=6604 RepID=UPI0022E06BFC|nr:uncharacterized protein LOC128235828 [Mya arenaria]
MSKAGYLDGGLTTHTFTVDPSLVGRFVQLQLKEITEFFHLCEVEVMAYPSVTHSKITKRIFDASNEEDGISSELTNSTPIVHVGQKLRLQCTANTGTFNTSVQIVWMKSSLENGGHLAPFSSDKQIIGEPKDFGLYSVDGNRGVLSKTTAKEFPINTTVISGTIGGVCALIILGAAGILLRRNISNGCCHRAGTCSLFAGFI